jgi:hypothetical protein
MPSLCGQTEFNRKFKIVFFVVKNKEILKNKNLWEKIFREKFDKSLKNIEIFL